MHTVPFGEIKQLTNYSRDWIIMKLEFLLAFDTDLRKVKRLVKEIGKELEGHPELGHAMMEPLKSQGVRRMEPAGMVVGLKFMGKPGSEVYALRREIYQRVRDAFEQNGIRFARTEVFVAGSATLRRAPLWWAPFSRATGVQRRRDPPCKGPKIDDDYTHRRCLDRNFRLYLVRASVPASNPAAVRNRNGTCLSACPGDRSAGAGGINRALAALILVLLLVVSVAAGALVLLWAIVGELSFFIDQFPRYVARVQSLVMDASRPWLHNDGEELHFNESSIKIATTMGGAWLHDAVLSLWSSGEALISLLALLVVVPIVSIYLLADWHRTIATVDGWVPASRREVVRALRSEIRDTISGFVRGQVVICLILALFYAASLKIVGLNHAILIGVTAGLISFVPYLGAAAGFVVAMCVAVAQFWPEWESMAIVGSIFLVGENLADYVLAPRIIGRRVKLNPVWLMFALFAFGYLFGFLGLLIAIPLAASLGVILRYAMRELLDASEHDTAPTAASGIKHSAISES